MLSLLINFLLGASWGFALVGASILFYKLFRNWCNLCHFWSTCWCLSFPIFNYHTRVYNPKAGYLRRVKEAYKTFKRDKRKRVNYDFLCYL